MVALPCKYGIHVRQIGLPNICLGFVATFGRKFALKDIFDRKPFDFPKRYEVEQASVPAHIKYKPTAKLHFL